MLDDFFSVLMAIVVVGGMTALTLPGRQTPAVARELSNGFANSIKAATGR